LYFYWNAFDIEEMVEEKIISSDFGEAADTWCWDCHVLVARAGPASLVVDPGAQVCPP
jgi:hypothetical protein